MTGCSVIVNQYDYQLTQTPPPTPQQSTSNSVVSTSDLACDEADSALLLQPAYSTLTSQNPANNQLTTSNLNSYNLYMSTNTYYTNLFETSFKNYKSNLIVDAGNELDPNDVHKLPNIYDE
jgi:hypothetical protein